MDGRAAFRLRDILQAIGDIRTLLAEKTSSDIASDRITRAALERFLEIISEASRHIPEALKGQHPTIPWRQIGDMGNHLRHAYHRTDAGILWEIYLYELDPLETAVSSMLAMANAGEQKEPDLEK